MRFPQLKLRPVVLFDSLVAIVLAAIVFAVFKQTYVPDTWFMGWDSVMSEFDLGLAWQRAITGVWQEFQGLGLIGGHGYVSDVARLPILWLLSLILPINMVRYAMAFGLWLTGALGAYFLGKKIVNYLVTNPITQVFLGFVVSVIYLFHPFTVQNFFVMHDSFSWFYAFLPWLLLIFGWVLTKPNLKRLLVWLGISFAFSFSGFIPPVFIGTLILLFFLSLGWWWTKKSIKRVKELVIVLIIFIAANSYWLFPLTYFTATGKQVYLDAKLNQKTTPENILKSENYGSWSKFIIGQGFYYDSMDVNNDGEVAPILKTWINWFNLPQIKHLLISLFILGLFGWLLSWKLLKNSPYSGLAIATFTITNLLVIGSPLFSWMSSLWYNIPLIGQAFRIPFTKLSSIYVLCLALMAVIGVTGITLFLKKIIKFNKTLIISLSMVIIGLMFLVSKPIWQGNFLYSRSKVTIPQEYFELMKFMKTQDKDIRVGVFPIHNNNGWYIQEWGYTGSGFLFYGIEQPIMDRTFDVWSKENESFYQQASYSFYNDDFDGLLKVFNKYQVSYLLIDKSIIEFNKDVNYNLEDLEKYLLKQGFEEVFKDNFLVVYDLRSMYENKGFISVPKQANVFGNDFGKIKTDSVFNSFGDYYFDQDNGEAVSLPFVNLLHEKPDNIELENDLLILSYDLKEDARVLKIPGLNEQLISLPLKFSYQENGIISVEQSSSFEILLGDKVLLNSKVNDFQIALNSDFPKILITIGDQDFILEKNHSQIISVRTKVPISLSLKAYQVLEDDKASDRVVINQASEQVFNIGDLDRKLGLIKKIDLNEAGKLIFKIPVKTINILENLKKNQDIKNCDALSRGLVKKEIENNEIVYLAEKNGVACESLPLDLASIQGSYLLKLNSNNNQGRALKFFITNSHNNYINLEDLLSKETNIYSLLPMDLNFGQYFINFDNRSVGSESSENILSSVEFSELMFPINWLSRISVSPDGFNSNFKDISINKSKRINNYLYLIDVEASEGSLVVLGQGFDKGWLAFNKNKPWQLFKHVKYNGWANAWLLPHGNYKIIIFYWPQLLSFVGYGFLIAMIAWLIKSKAK
jgi:hypothetical protein